MKSTLGKISGIMILLVFLIASILVLNIAKAQNETFNETQAENNTSLIDVLEDVTNNETVDNETSSEDFVLSEEEPPDILNETVENVTSNISINETLENITSNETVEIINETLTTNETSNETSQFVDLNQTNETLEENETVEILNETNETFIEPVEPIFDVNLEYPEKITREENLIVRANVKNIGFLAKNVVLRWMLPYGFEIISGNEEEYCGDLDTDDSCYSEISIKTDLSTILGLNGIKVVVSYEE